MTIESNRTLGGIGALLTITGVVSTVASISRLGDLSSTNLAYFGVSLIIGLLTFVGFILFLVAMHGFSRDYKDHRIFNLILWGIVITIIAAVVAVVISFVILLANLAIALPSLNQQPSSPNVEAFLNPFLGPFVAVFGFVGLINIVFNVRAFNLLADKSAVPMFRTGAKVLLAGGLVTVVLGIIFAAFAATEQISFETFGLVVIPGALIQYLAWALLAKAFFTIKAPPTQTVIPPTDTASFLQTKFCSGCGAQNQTDSTYCVQCGNKL